MKNFLERATSLLERGLSVIPIKPRDKAPIYGVTHRTQNAEVVATWAAQFPNANVGVTADERTVILDADDAAALIAKTGPLDTYTVESSPGKAHYYFRRDGFTVRNLELGNLGSLRAENMYVVGAGSVHPKTGLPYRVINDVPLASMGQGLYRHLESLAEEATREINRVILQWDGKEKIGEGSRQYFLRSQAGKLWNGERTEEEMFAVLQELNQKFCDPPKSDGELSRLVTWVMQKEPNPPAIQVTLGGTLPNKEPEKWDALNRGVLLAQKIPPRTALLQDGDVAIFYERSVNQIFAWRGVGKTNFALGLGGALASGGRILNFQATRASRILYVDGELPAAQLQERVRDFIPDAYDENVLCISPELLGLTRAFNFFDQKDFDALRDVIERYHIEVVFLDSQSTVLSGDSLKAEFQEARQRRLLELRFMGVCVVELHHEGKSGQQRSTSKNDDILDVQMQLKKVADWEERDALTFEMVFPKIRHKRQGLQSGYEVTFEAGVWRAQASDIQKLAAEMLKGGASIRAVAKELGVDKGRVERVKRRLSRDKLAVLNQAVSVSGT